MKPTAVPARSEVVGEERSIAVGRRLFLGMLGLGAAGIAFGAAVQEQVGWALGSGPGRLLPGGDDFQIYSVSGSFPAIAPYAYRLEVTGLVERPTTFTLADLQVMPAPWRLPTPSPSARWWADGSASAGQPGTRRVGWPSNAVRRPRGKVDSGRTRSTGLRAVAGRDGGSDPQAALGRPGDRAQSLVHPQADQLSQAR